MAPPPDLSRLTEADKDALTLALGAQVQELPRQNAALAGRVAALEAKLRQPAKTPDNSSLPPSKAAKANRADPVERTGPRQGRLGRTGGGRPLAEEPDPFVSATAAACVHCPAALGDTAQVLQARYDKIDLRPGGRGWSALLAIARAAVARRWRRSRRAWKRARRSASRSWRSRSTCVSSTPSAIAG